MSKFDKTTYSKTSHSKTSRSKTSRRKTSHQETLPNFELPPGPAASGYSSKQVVKIAGITYRQLDHWDRIDFIKPSAKKAKGCGSRRQYSYQDLLRFKVAKRLLDNGVNFHMVIKVFEYMEKELGDDIVTANLVIDGDQVYYERDPQNILDLIQRGQGVLNLVGIPAINSQLQAEVIALFSTENKANGSDSGIGEVDTASASSASVSSASVSSASKMS